MLKIRVKKQTTMTIISNTRLKSPMEQKLGLHVLSFFLPFISSKWVPLFLPYFHQGEGKKTQRLIVKREPISA